MSSLGQTLRLKLGRVLEDERFLCPDVVVEHSAKIVATWPTPVVAGMSGAAIPDAASFYRNLYMPVLGTGGGVFEPEGRLNGTWVFGGFLFGHFGHFLMESLSRLWVLDHLADQKIDGITFLSTGGGAFREERDIPLVAQGVLDRCNVDVPVRLLSGSFKVENLIVPSQGCGLGHMAAGLDPVVHAADIGYF